MLAKSPVLLSLGRRAAAQAKNIKPARGGKGDHHADHGHVTYEQVHLTSGNHPGRAGNNWGTGYMPVGDSPGEKLAIGLGVSGLVVGGVGIVLWSAWRQGQWSK
ncbi:hypothetical protein T484DRAFT_1946078 [Baffinella frigidus]|nr:hypothetical protein T484DRAFT_1946078 [Cryptophyta sp. CCMP2293]